jgi:UDPglucose 6-dehydrogenase
VTELDEKVAVVGLWHLGSVTSACLASIGHHVAGFDPDGERVAQLAAATPPVAEPGLAELIAGALDDGTLIFTNDPEAALAGAQVVWITFDTPVDDDDHADTEAVVRQTEALAADLEPGATVIVSSQLPIGTTARIERLLAAARPEADIGVACSPENLQLGRAVDAFLHPARVVVGVRSERDRCRIAALLEPLGTELLWTTPESAEMSKHALNAWLAMSVAFTNEVARLCEETGAQAGEVEQALRSEPRIGMHAYVHAGGSFAGGTLARDLEYLREIGADRDAPTPLLDGVRASNDCHAGWARQTIDRELEAIGGCRIAVLGLTYKPGTDTLRRSSSIELCRELASEGAEVIVHDPAARELPGDLDVERAGDVEAALRGARAVVIATPWPEYVDAVTELLAAHDEPMLVVDPTGLLADLADRRGIVYRAVGRPR